VKNPKRRATAHRRAAKPRKAATAPLTQFAPLDLQQRYTVPEALAYLRTSRKSLYVLIAHGRIVPIREGSNGKGRTYIPGTEIARLSRAPIPEPITPTP
jgi:hypothetical protein